MRYTRLPGHHDHWFNNAWGLYNQSFPPEERRTTGGQALAMNKPPYHVEVALEGDQFIGIIFWWGFKDLRYLEHLAIRSDLRGRGYGKKVLGEYMQRDKRKILLDVELPVDEINKRRIRFYERAGFILNQHEYFQPSMREGSGPVPLLMMSFPGPLSGAELKSFIKECHPVIYDI